MHWIAVTGGSDGARVSLIAIQCIISAGSSSTS
jgi:hypothetical protein